MDPSLGGRMPSVPYKNQSSGFRLKPRTIAIIVGVLLAIIIGFVLMSLGGDKSGPLQLRLNARLGTLEKMIEAGDKSIKDTDLKELNGRLKIQLISEQISLSKVMKAGKADKSITTSEADKASFDALEEARLNSRFDDAYRRLIAQKLDSTSALIKELYDTTPSSSLQTTLNSSYNNFKQLEGQFTPASE